MASTTESFLRRRNNDHPCYWLILSYDGVTRHAFGFSVGKVGLARRNLALSQFDYIVSLFEDVRLARIKFAIHATNDIIANACMVVAFEGLDVHFTLVLEDDGAIFVSLLRPFGYVELSIGVFQVAIVLEAFNSNRFLCCFVCSQRSMH